MRCIKPTLATLKPRLATITTATIRTTGRAWMDTRTRILARDGGVCCECRRLGIGRAAQEVDHITPLKRGGTDADENLQSLCIECHAAKTAKEAST